MHQDGFGAGAARSELDLLAVQILRGRDDLVRGGGGIVQRGWQHAAGQGQGARKDVCSCHSGMHGDNDDDGDEDEGEDDDDGEDDDARDADLAAEDLLSLFVLSLLVLFCLVRCVVSFPFLRFPSSSAPRFLHCAQR